ncbi:hypothetical protein [Yoonia sp.]|uniref:hypothetical protein n=1 Tax=Yoonia sp. TaxID=2212373 RepID=UPI002DFA9453|nr:hypothetical protein [Yoonia sp.]
MKKTLLKVAGVMSALSFLLMSLVAQHAIAEEIPAINRAAVDLIVDEYRANCRQELGPGAEGGLIVPEDRVYELIIDDQGTKATALYTDFTCGDWPMFWCGTGGCDSYIIVDGKIFQWRVSFAPYALQIPNPYTPNTRAAVLFPLHGIYCKSARDEPGYGMFGCYEIALWDQQAQTFMTRSGSLREYDPRMP